MADNKRRRLVGAIIVLIGAVLLIAAAFLPWYMVEEKATVGTYNITIDRNSYPGLPGSNGTIQFSCSGLPPEFPCSAQTSYNDARMNNTGNIAEAGYFMMIVGFVLGLVGALMGIMSRSNARRSGMAIVLAVIAMILAVAAVGLFAALLPGAIGSDATGHTGTGPWSSFFGSSNNATNLGTPPGGTASWGPAIGWYMALVAFVILLIGVIVIMMARKDVEPAPAPAPAAPAAAPGAPPATPPPSS